MIKYKVKRVRGSFTNSFSGRHNSTATILVNEDGKSLAYEGAVYRPIGGGHAFNALIKSGDINAPCFSWI
jgi:hypothetical protein